MTGKSAFQLLDDAQALCLQRGQTNPAQSDQQWSGVLFAVAEAHVLAPLAMLQEVVSAPTWVRVPGVKPWLRGLANVHGSLVPVVDIEGFLLGSYLPTQHASQRLLVINDGGNRMGLLVREVLGMKHFSTDDEVNEQPALDARIQTYVTAALQRYGDHYAVLDLRKLFSDPAFLHCGINQTE
jgi:twitching motility protein PilI